MALIRLEVFETIVATMPSKDTAVALRSACPRWSPSPPAALATGLNFEMTGFMCRPRTFPVFDTTKCGAVTVVAPVSGSSRWPAPRGGRRGAGSRRGGHPGIAWPPGRVTGAPVLPVIDPPLL